MIHVSLSKCKVGHSVGGLSFCSFRRTVIMTLSAFTLELSLPPDYPTKEYPHAYLHCAADVPTSVRKEARQLLAETIATLELGDEVLDLLLTSMNSGLETLASSTSSHKDSSAACNVSKAGQGGEPLIRRQLFWSHHLLATSKRRDILSWSRELHLGGYSRPGYPGVILIEGSTEAVGEFERRIKALRWQALQVRGEDDGEHRMFGDGTTGVQEVEDIGDIVKGLKEKNADLASWFLAGMKIGHG